MKGKLANGVGSQYSHTISQRGVSSIRARAEPDVTRAETTFCLPPKRTSRFKSAGESVQSTAGSRGARISVSNAGYITCRGGVGVLVTPSIRQFPLHFPSRASPCATTFRKQYNTRCFYTATMVARTRLTVTRTVRCLSCCSNDFVTASKTTTIYCKNSLSSV